MCSFHNLYGPNAAKTKGSTAVAPASPGYGPSEGHDGTDGGGVVGGVHRPETK